MLKFIAEDLRSQREGLLSQGFWALLVHRLAEPRQRIRSRLVRGLYYIVYRILQKGVESWTGISIGETAVIGRRLVIEHFGGIIVHGNSVIGDDVMIRQGVTLGNSSETRSHEAPRIGDRVSIGAGAKILGPIVIGNDVAIGANAVVISDIPEGMLAVGVPAKIKPRQAASQQ